MKKEEKEKKTREGMGRKKEKGKAEKRKGVGRGSTAPWGRLEPPLERQKRGN